MVTSTVKQKLPADNLEDSKEQIPPRQKSGLLDVHAKARSTTAAHPDNQQLKVLSVSQMRLKFSR